MTTESKLIAVKVHHFCVRAVFSPSTGWNVKLAETRDITLSQESKEDFENVPTEVDGDEVE